MEHTLETRFGDPATLREHPANARRSNLDELKQSLRTLGQYKPVVVNARTGYVIAGNHTLRALKELGAAQVAYVEVDVDEPTEQRIMLADNRLGDLGSYDDTALAELLQNLDDFTGTGYTSDDLDDLLFALENATFTPSRTDAHFNETDDDYEARVTRLAGYESHEARGIAEVIFVLAAEQKAELLRLLEALRPRYGETLTNGELVLRAVRECADA